MNTETFKKLEYIISGYGITQEDLNSLIDLIDENAQQAKNLQQTAVIKSVCDHNWKWYPDKPEVDKCQKCGEIRYV